MHCIDKVIMTICTAALLLALCGTARAETPFVTPKIGTLGVGVDLGIEINDSLKVRINPNYFRFFLRDKKLSDLEYDLDIDLFTVGGIVDYHPFGGGFRISGGIFYNGSSADLEGSAELTGTIQVGPIELEQTVIANLVGTAIYQPIAPYAGIGWGLSGKKDRNWHFSLDAGALYLGNSTVSLRAPLALADPLVDLVEEEEEEVEDELNNYRWYPVVMLGVTYRF
jgi:hypothetical protein